MQTLTVESSRRLTGPNILCDAPGAVLDVSVSHDPARIIAEWKARARRLLDTVAWHAETVHVRPFPGGASLLLTAPVDALYAATEVNERAWEATLATARGEPEPDFQETGERLKAVIAEERNPALLALRAAAGDRGVSFLSDDEYATVGMGRGSMTWPVGSLPDPNTVPWDRIHDVPVALVTGSNGKTTTVRLLAAIAQAAGRTAGYSSTDGVFVDDTLVAAGDYSGPEGARTVLREPRVELAFLETARGGILRRGLPVTRADVALVTNVAADHLGEFGVLDIDAIAEVKLVVSRAVAWGGMLVLNADDPALATRAEGASLQPTWMSLDPAAPRVRAHVGAGGAAFVVEDGEFVIVRGGRHAPVAAVMDVPVTIGGAARYNVYNALGAVAAATGLGISPDHIRAGLGRFRSSASENPGRTNLFEYGDVTVLVDFAHNPHGMDALVDLGFSLPAKRRLIILGQAGDRDDTSIRELAHAAWRLRPQRIIIKEMREYLRGRTAGEIPAMIHSELHRIGTPADIIFRADSELEAVRDALRWARAGDLLLLPIHAQRSHVLHLMEQLDRQSWRAGRDLPS